jgi:coenzyme F420 hydrogenase subunit beta
LPTYLHYICRGKEFEILVPVKSHGKESRVMLPVNKGAKGLFEDVVNKGLCTGCGACIKTCPYRVAYEGRIVVLDECILEEGDCYKHCPRTYTDLNAVSEKIFGVPFGDEEVGHAMHIFMARSRDTEIKERAQDGGTVTTLLVLALEEGTIDAVVCTRMDEDKVARGYLARNREELFQCAGSSYEASFVLEAYRSIPKEDTEKLAIVGLGCEIEALSKIKTYPPKNSVNPDNIKCTVGLFCGWALLPDTFHPYLKELCDPSQAVKFDIPHTPHYTFDVYTESDVKSVSLDDIRAYINPACQYCWNMTAEFSDISVGAAGSKFPGWNTVIIRTDMGAHLMEVAKKKGILETHALPDQRLAHLKTVAVKRKKMALKNIVEKTGNKKDLLYVGGLSQGIAKKLLED